MIWLLSTILCTISAILLLLDYFVKRCETYQLAKRIPATPMWPIVGSLDFFGATQHTIYPITLKYCKKFPNGFGNWGFGIFIYHVYSAEGFEKIATNPKHIEKSFAYKFLSGFLGAGLLTSTGERWSRRRKLLTPAFHFNVLNRYQATFSEQTALLIKVIREQETNRTEGSNLQKLISRFTLNTICESAMGVKVKRINQLDDYRRKINDIGTLQVERLTAPLFYNDWMYKWLGDGRKLEEVIRQVRQFTGNIITTKRAKFQMEGKQKQTTDYSNKSEYYGRKQRFAMLDTLLLAELEQKIDAGGIQEEVDTFVFEGFDTTMTAVTFVLFMIAHHSEVQDQLFEEIKSMGAESDTKYLDAVIKESMRLYPPVPFIGRVLGEDTVIDNIKFPTGTVIHILIYALHRSSKYFPNPENFDPTRFLGNETTGRHPFAFVPFSGGQRNCIGQKFAMMEVRTVVSEIVKNFKLEPVTLIEDVEIIADLVLRSKDPIRIKFALRNDE